MLQIDKVQQIQGITVYGDDKSAHTFYLLPQAPRFRIENGKPVMKFVKYRELRRDGDDLFGGICAFDVEFTVPDDKRAAVVAELQRQVDERYARSSVQPPKVIVGTVTYTGGTANLNIGEGTALVQRVRGAGKPSLYGNNVATFWVELTQQGATVFEQALQGEGGFVSVVYDLTIWARLPPITARAWWHASAFYSFFQEIDTDDNFWSEDSYEETIRETLIRNDVMGTEFNFVGNPTMSSEDQRKVESDIRSAITRQLEDAVARNMLQEIQATDPDVKHLHEDRDIEDIKRVVTKTQIANVNINWRESHVVEWQIAPQGLLPNITSLTGPDGKPYKWSDYALDVDLDDPFFRTLELVLRVNADFVNLPIFNVTVHINYANQALPESFVFSGPDDVARFRAFIENDIRKYKYSYQVNYRGDSRVMNSPQIETDNTQLTINVDDLGILIVDVDQGDINFQQVRQAQIVIRYEDSGITPVERQFIMSPQQSSFQIREVIFKPRDKPIRFKVKYFMTDGREYTVDWHQQQASQIYINDPFSATKTVGLRALGDLDLRIRTIMVDLTYRDAANNYVQTQSVSLSKNQPFFDWEFPVIDEEAGEVTYSGTIQYTDGTVRDLPEQTATRSTIQLGDVVTDRLDVTIVPNLVDFGLVRLAVVNLRYIDEENGIDSRKDFIFQAGAPIQNWVVDLKDRNRRDFTWGAQFFLIDGSQRTIPNQVEQGQTIILEIPN